MYNQFMGRKSRKDQRRSEIISAFAQVLAEHGYSGATIIAVAAKAGLTPGLLHHYFANKQEMLNELFSLLQQSFRKRAEENTDNTQDQVKNYVEAALKLGQKSDLISAKCWVGVLAEALKEPALYERLKRYLDSEVKYLMRISKGRLDEKGSAGVIAFILGSLVFGAYAPRKTAGFAANIGLSLYDTLIK